jgi:hypothetical protein
MRAFAAQHRHDFATAARLLARVIAADPRDADARLALAQLDLVQGRLDRARGGCAALALGVDVQAGWLCVAAYDLRRGDTAGALAAADRWFARPATDAETLRYALLVRAEIAARAGAADADGWYRRALALGADDVRAQAAYARWLADQGRHAEVLALVGDAPQTDGLALRRALSARALGAPQADAWAADVGRRYARLRAAGAVPEPRDEAEYLLVLRGEPAAALAIAQANFARQKDAGDERVLVRSAQAAGRPDALAMVAQWRAAQGLPAEAAP